MLEVKREGGETIDKLLRRYSDKLKRTGQLSKVKYGSVYNRKPNKHARKLSALYKLKKRQRMEYLKRIGKIDDKNFDSTYGFQRSF